MTTPFRTAQDAISFVKSELADLIYTNKLSEDEIMIIACSLLKFAKQNMDNVIEECRLFEKKKTAPYFAEFIPVDEEVREGDMYIDPQDPSRLWKLHPDKVWFYGSERWKKCKKVKLFLCQKGQIIGEISRKADWVKEKDTFTEEDIKLWNVVKHKGSETRALHPTLIGKKGVKIIAQIKHPYKGKFY